MFLTLPFLLALNFIKNNVRNKLVRNELLNIKENFDLLYYASWTNDFKNREQIVFDLFFKLNTINKHKMIPIPVCKIPKYLTEI